MADTAVRYYAVHDREDPAGRGWGEWRGATEAECAALIRDRGAWRVRGDGAVWLDVSLDGTRPGGHADGQPFCVHVLLSRHSPVVMRRVAEALGVAGQVETVSAAAR